MPNDNDISRCAWRTTPCSSNITTRSMAAHAKATPHCLPSSASRAFRPAFPGAQCLAKQPAFERAFCGFDPWRCAELSDAYLDFLMQDAGIIRNRRKIYAVRQNAQALLWHYPAPGDFRRLVYSGILPEALSRQLKQQSFCFCGPTICESFLMSVGAIEAHEPGCALFGTHAAPLP